MEHPLSCIPEFPPAWRELLGNYRIQSSEQLYALLLQNDARGRLQAMLGLAPRDFRMLLRSLCAALPLELRRALRSGTRSGPMGLGALPPEDGS